MAKLALGYTEYAPECLFTHRGQGSGDPFVMSKDDRQASVKKLGVPYKV